MRVVVCNSFAPLDQLAIEDRPDLGAGPGQVVIDVEAAGANFVDALLVQGLYQIKPPLPFVPGMEIAGTVRSVGDGVDTVVAGDRVMGMSFFGGYASQVVLPARATTLIPGALTAGQAAGLVQSYATMLFALTRRTTVAEGEWVAVLGAGGGIGLATVDLAKALGAQVVACASSTAKLEAAVGGGRGCDDCVRRRPRRSEGRDPRSDRRWRRHRRRPDRRSEGGRRTARVAMDGSLPRDRFRGGRDPAPSAQPGAVEQPYGDRRRLGCLDGPRSRRQRRVAVRAVHDGRRTAASIRSSPSRTRSPTRPAPSRISKVDA